MNDMDYKPNSHKYREAQSKTQDEEKHIEKVVEGKVKVKKKGELHKLADVFISEDIKNVKSYVLNDVLVPTIKKAISDVVRDGIDMILFGDTSSSRKRGIGSNYVSYRSYSDPRDDRRSRNDDRNRPSGLEDEIVFESRGEAEAVRNEMMNTIDRYGLVTVSDLYDMSNLEKPYTGNRFGWTNIRNSEVVRVRDGYIIKLPKAMPID